MSKSKSQPSSWLTIRNRVIAGLVIVLPLFLTWVIIKWLYDTFISVFIGPIRDFLLGVWYPEAETLEPTTWVGWIISGIASLAAIALVLGLLFIAGMFFQSRIHRFVDWFFSNVPGVNTIYTAVRNVVSAFQTSTEGVEKFKRVVLVKFPHPGMKAPAFVTSEIKDSASQKTILSVYVPTTPIPTSGYMLLVPEEEVVPLDWDLEETLQAIVSGGISVPGEVRYDSVDRPVIDVKGGNPTNSNNKS